MIQRPAGRSLCLSFHLLSVTGLRGLFRLNNHARHDFDFPIKPSLFLQLCARVVNGRSKLCPINFGFYGAKM